MNVKNLGDTPFETIVTCFLSAFDNYFVKMPEDPAYYHKRWKAARVRFDRSYGMFDGEKLAGFIINGIDRRNGQLTAFNTGTGVLPEYRGNRIVKAIYDHAIPDLVKNGITKCSLEVIKANEPAVKAYKSVGFAICKGYKCFSGPLTADPRTEAVLKELRYDELDWDNLPDQDCYSWEHHKNSVREGDYRYFQLLKDGVPRSYFIINPENGYVAQLGVFNSNKTTWNDLFAAIRSISPTVKINNVDERLSDKLAHIAAAGPANTIDQYEMELQPGHSGVL
ncbi:MAG: GNAT family N-acetyltransferase [Sinomicrobium sp.]|nr:GNAT family N-acetyltransferase [Sinomicrobium sp.]